jgi:hypothetical protein
MIRIHVPWVFRAVACVGVMAVSTAACGPSGFPSPDPSSSAASSPSIAVSSSPSVRPSPSATPTVSPSASAVVRNPAAFVKGQPYKVTIDAADFVATIDNPFMPLKPGTTFTFNGAEHVEVTVTEKTKTIVGVPATVVRDKVFDGSALVEDTLDWYAQDRAGNVWYLGEQTAEYRDGKVVSRAGSWEAGVDGAQPGILMLADPKVGDVYRQEYLAGEAEDMAEITATDGGSITVPFGTFDNILVTEEWTPLEPGVRERKTYVRGIGVVETREIKGGSGVTALADVKPKP